MKLVQILVLIFLSVPFLASCSEKDTRQEVNSFRETMETNLSLVDQKIYSLDYDLQHSDEHLPEVEQLQNEVKVQAKEIKEKLNKLNYMSERHFEKQKDDIEVSLSVLTERLDQATM